MTNIKPDFVSKTKFNWWFQENLQILNDQKTLIGVENNEKNNYSKIAIEDIINTNPNYVSIKFPLLVEVKLTSLSLMRIRTVYLLEMRMGFLFNNL